MSNIQENLQKILSAVWGKDVRQAIHDAIHDCYEDGSAGSVDLIAREGVENLETDLETEATTRSDADQGIIDDLNDYKEEVSRITTATPQQATNLINVTGSETILRKNGKFVEAKIRFTVGNSNIPAPTTLFNFPEGYRPIAVLRIMTYDWGLASNHQFNVYSTGEFQTVGILAGNSSFILSFVYMVA